MKSARAGSERFCSQARFGKRWNTVCISRFSNRGLGAKDPLSSRRRFIQSFPKAQPGFLDFPLLFAYNILDLLWNA